MKRVQDEEQQNPSVEAKKQKTELQENVTEAESEDFQEDVVDDTEIEWLIDASLSDDPFKNHLAQKILEQEIEFPRKEDTSKPEIEVPKTVEPPKPNIEKKLVKQTKLEGNIQEKILEQLKEKVQEKLEISELKMIKIVKDKDCQISKLNFELESIQLEQKSVEEKMKNTLLTTANMIKSLRMEKEDMELKVLENEKKQDLFAKREENLELSIKEAMQKDMQKEKTLQDLREQIEAFKAEADKATAEKNLLEKKLMDENEALIKSSEMFKAEADKAIAEKNFLEKQFWDENKDLNSKIDLLKSDLEEKDCVLKDVHKKLKAANDEAQETSKQSQLKLDQTLAREKELSGRVEELEKMSTSAESLILRKINIINEKEEDIKKKDLCIKSLEKEIDNLKGQQLMEEKEVEDKDILLRKEQDTLRAQITKMTEENDDCLRRKENEVEKLSKENEDLKTKNITVIVVTNVFFYIKYRLLSNKSCS